MIDFGLSVQVSQVVKSYDSGLSPLKGVSFSLEPGKFLALIGPSGCGKTTLLKMIAHLREPSSGEIKVGKEKTDEERRVAYVFQDAYLLPWRKVLENVTLPLEILGASKVERELKARKALERVGLIDFESYYPANLSGGMKMRVSLARSLVNNPNLLLLDEPFAALDEVTRLRLDQDLRNLWAESQMTVVFVTHSISEAAFLADRIIMLSTKTGKIQHDIINPLPKNRTLETRALPEFSELTQDLFLRFQELEA
jgi:NitT/TauT family transport system ATP-binding protein